MTITTMRFDKKLSSARAIAKALTPAENTIDQSIVENARLLMAIAAGRIEAGLALENGHDAVMSAVAGIASLGQARDHAVRCHQQLSVVRDGLNLRSDDVGCTGSKGSLEPAREVAA